MPVDPHAGVEITAFSQVPPPAQGLVRDLRVRWACDEIELPYRARLMDAMAPRPPEYLREQPFAQIPTYHEGGTHLFESGAILLHIGEKDERLLPRDPAQRGRAIAWLFAALNSVEPALQALFSIDHFYAGEEWAKLRRPGAAEFARLKLSRVSAWLGDRAWLEDRFTIGDLMMITVLRILNYNGMVENFPNLATYVASGEARPAFKSALDAQLSALCQHQLADAEI